MDMDVESVVQHASYSIRASCTSLVSDTPGFEALGLRSNLLKGASFSRLSRIYVEIV